MSGFSSLAVATPYASGRYVTPRGQGALAGGGTTASGTIAWVPGKIDKPVTIGSLLVNLTTLAAGGNFQIALYASDPTTGDPTGAPIYQSPSQSTAATGVKEITGVNKSVGAGTYWFAIQRDNATCGFACPSSTVSPSDGMTAYAGQTGSANILKTDGTTAIGYFKTGTFGTFPTLTGNVTTDGLLALTGSGSAWAFKVA